MYSSWQMQLTPELRLFLCPFPRAVSSHLPGDPSGVYRPPKMTPASMELDERRAAGGTDRRSAQEERRVKELKSKWVGIRGGGGSPAMRVGRDRMFFYRTMLHGPGPGRTTSLPGPPSPLTRLFSGHPFHALPFT